MKGKKILAAVLAAAMVLGSSVTVFAGSQEDFPETDSGQITNGTKDDDGKDLWNEGVGGGTEGAGAMAGAVDRKVFHVILPTEDVDLLKSALDFQLDPQKLISGDGTLVASGEYADGKTLYFPNVVSGGAVAYHTDKSNKFTVMNKGSVKVTVSVEAELSELDKSGTVSVSEDRTFANDTTTSMYMAIVTGTRTDGKDTTVPLKSEDNDKSKAKASIAPATIDAVSSGAFKVVRKADGKYEYVLKDESDRTQFAKFEFWLEGAANEAGDWDAFVKDGLSPAPKLKLTWNVKPYSDAYVSSTNLTVGQEKVTLTKDGVTIKSVILNKADGSQVTLKLNDTYTFNATTKELGIKDVIVKAYKDTGTIDVTYSDDHKDTLKIK